MHFAIRAPQTITFSDPDDKDAAPLQINFRMNGADTSRCVLELVIPETGVHEITFNRGGDEVSRKYTPQGEQRDAADETDFRKAPPNYMEGGRDTRADNPYTHVAPVDADTAARDAQANPGFKAAQPVENEGDLRQQAMEKAASDAEETRRKAREDADKDPAERAKEFKDKNRERADEALHAQEQDAANDVPPQTTPAYDPNIPPASSPLPGSPAPQPESDRNHGIVNRSDGTSVNTERPAEAPRKTEPA